MTHITTGSFSHIGIDIPPTGKQIRMMCEMGDRRIVQHLSAKMARDAAAALEEYAERLDSKLRGDGDD